MEKPVEKLVEERFERNLYMQIVCQTHGMGEGEIICSKCVEFVEQKINILQHLQAKIRAVVSRIDVAVEKCDGSYSRVDIANELRELSAMQ